jgi:hypothetical protein
MLKQLHVYVLTADLQDSAPAHVLDHAILQDHDQVCRGQELHLVGGQDPGSAREQPTDAFGHEVLPHMSVHS